MEKSKKEKKEEPKGFWFVEFGDGSIEVFESSGSAKKKLKEYDKVPDEQRGTFPIYLHGPVLHLYVKPPQTVAWEIWHGGKGCGAEDLVPDE